MQLPAPMQQLDAFKIFNQYGIFECLLWICYLLFVNKRFKEKHVKFGQGVLSTLIISDVFQVDCWFKVGIIYTLCIITFLFNKVLLVKIHVANKGNMISFVSSHFWCTTLNRFTITENLKSKFQNQFRKLRFQYLRNI